MQYELPKLDYKYDALEPFIDAKTMEIHHTKHHQAYVDKLNEALAKHPELAHKQIEELLKDIGKIPQDIKTAIQNHGGGHVNHSLFWQIMTPNAKDRMFTGKIAETIKKDFGSFEKFKEEFTSFALKVFGSGWAWLVIDYTGKLAIMSTANQDSPLMFSNRIPILGLDVWEHAYYLKYMNKRAEYVGNWWNIVNWKKVGELYEMAGK